MIYEEVFHTLQKANIRYVVVGGMAVNFHGALRSTADLDLMVYLEDNQNVLRFAQAMNNLGYKPRVPVPAEDLANSQKRKEWQEEKGALVFTFLKTKSFESVDVFLNHPIAFDDVFSRRKRVIIDDIEISVASLQDLKTLKKLAGRDKDLMDIKAIEQIENLKDE